ncbi:hypothetical protein L1887_14643 [Cichorium endivia]|nr:hypothetical protein L1887_14643 [Cichorium endivia]
MERKNPGCSSSLFVILLAIGSFFATYNLITLVVQNRPVSPGKCTFDPLLVMPGKMKGNGGKKALFHLTPFLPVWIEFWDLKNGWTTNIKLLRKLLKTVESYKRAQLALGIGDEDLAREALKRRKSYAITNLSIYCRQKFLSIIATYLYLFTYKGNVLSFYFQHKQWVKNCKYFAIM